MLTLYRYTLTTTTMTVTVMTLARKRPVDTNGGYKAEVHITGDFRTKCCGMTPATALSLWTTLTERIKKGGGELEDDTALQALCRITLQR